MSISTINSLKHTPSSLENEFIDLIADQSVQQEKEAEVKKELTLEQLATIVNSIKQVVASHEKTISSQGGEIEKLQKEVFTLSQENKGLKTTIQILEREKESLESTQNTLTAKINLLESQKKELESSNRMKNYSILGISILGAASYFCNQPKFLKEVV